MKPVAYPKQDRSPSFNQESPFLSSSASPTDQFADQKLDNIERYLNKFDERAARLDLSIKSPLENRSFTSQKRTLETSYSEYDQKIRIEDGGYRNNKVENPRRVNTSYDQSHDVPKNNAPLRDLLPSENKQDDIRQVHERVSGIEKRVDSMDKRLEQLTSTLESFMQRIEGRLTMPERPSFPERQSIYEPSYKVERQSTLERQNLPDREFIPERQSRVDRRPTPERQAPRQEQIYGERETVSEVKLLGNNKRSDAPIRIEDELPPRRAASRDNTGNLRERAREFLERGDKERVGVQERQVERREDKSPLRVGVPPKDVKGGLKTPDSERKRKNVSWSELGSPEVVETESVQKRKKFETNYEDLESSKLFSMDESFKRGDKEKEKERPRSNIRSRDRLDESSRLTEVTVQKRTSVTREDVKAPLYDSLHEKYGRYKSDVRADTEDRFGERTMTNESEVGNPVEKERMMEEKRKKIDDEIERRISKQIEMKKKADAAIEGQKKVYEKTSQVEEDFKISPYSTEKSRDKEVVARLVREKQMRTDLISKYSETASDPSNKSKSPLRK